MIWETNHISALVDEAYANGSSVIELGSVREAKLFRQAIYNRYAYQKIHCPFLISVLDRTVTIKRRSSPCQ